MRSKRATFYINLHGQVRCFCLKRPEWPVTFLRDGHTYKHLTDTHTNVNLTVNPIQIKPPPSSPLPSSQALPARYATLRSQPTTPYIHNCSLEDSEQFCTTIRPTTPRLRFSPLRHSRATLHINPHGRVCCFWVKRPEWPVTILRDGIHIQACTVNPIHIKPPPSAPFPSPPALPARYATLRSQLLQCTLIIP
jgi:hypothetical protein